MAEDLSPEERSRAREAINFFSSLTRRGEPGRQDQQANESNPPSSSGTSASQPVGTEADCKTVAACMIVANSVYLTTFKYTGIHS